MDLSALRVEQLYNNPLNVFLLGLLIYTAYPLATTLLPSRKATRRLPNTPTVYNWIPDAYPESLVWDTYTPMELRRWDGRDGGRILVAINRLVYDLSAGRSFYGPDGPYGNFAGRDASRGLAKQSFDEDVLTPVDAAIDDLKDLTDSERHNLAEWEMHFKGKYIICGDFIENSDRLLQPR